MKGLIFILLGSTTILLCGCSTVVKEPENCLWDGYRMQCEKVVFNECELRAKSLKWTLSYKHCDRDGLPEVAQYLLKSSTSLIVE